MLILRWQHMNLRTFGKKDKMAKICNKIQPIKIMISLYSHYL